MPGTFLTTAERERLSRFPDAVSHPDLMTYFALSHNDQAFIDPYRSDSHRLGVALQLCAMRYLGFCPVQISTAPQEVIRSLAAQLHVPSEALGAYGSRAKTRQGHVQDVLSYLGFRRFQSDDQDALQEWLLERALEHDKPTLLLHMTCEHLKQQKLMRPGVTILERLVVSARLQAHYASLSRLQPLLSQPVIDCLDSLLAPEPDSGRTTLYTLRQHATTNTPAALVKALDTLSLLRQWDIDQWDLTLLNPNRQKFLARLGRKYTAQALRRMGPERRYPILVAFLKETMIDLTDEIIDIFDVCVATRHKKARSALEEYQAEVAKTTSAHSILLHEIGQLVLDEAIADATLRQSIYLSIPPEKLRAAIEEAKTLSTPNGYYDFLDDHYSYIRQFAPQFLASLPFTSHEKDDPLLEAVATLRQLNTAHQRKLPDDISLDFVPDRWRRFVQNHGEPSRRAYELCTLSTLRDALRAGDIYVPTSRRYADPETYLIPKSQWPRLRADICEELHLDRTGSERLSQRVAELQTLLPRLDRTLHRTEGIRIAEGQLIVPDDEGEDLPPSAKALEEHISRRLPHVELPEVLLEVDQWTHFSRRLTHADSGYPRTDALLLNFYATLLAQGTNMGLTEMAHSTNLTYDRLAWTNTWYLREETLKAVVTALVNFQYTQPLAQHWGSGTLSSSDGQRFPVRGKVRNAVSLPKYFGYGQGITFYTWTSDQFSQYGTKVIATTIRDATYVLDEILDNETDLAILEHTTDTAGYTDVVFALFDLLGMQFSPRIRDLGHQRLYKLKNDHTLYKRLDARLTGRVDPTRLIDRWDNLARVAGSLKRGYVTASLLISKLQAYPRQNHLTKLLQEYGRLVKTIFILRYLEDQSLRQRVHAQLNKGEALHQLRKFLFFVRDGAVLHKDEEDQNNQAACLNILTNAVIVWNTVYMQAALEALREEGYAVEDDDLVHLSPARFAHIHRYGKYHFDVETARSRRRLRPLRR